MSATQSISAAPKASSRARPGGHARKPLARHPRRGDASVDAPLGRAALLQELAARAGNARADILFTRARLAMFVLRHDRARKRRSAGGRGRGPASRSRPGVRAGAGRPPHSPDCRCAAPRARPERPARRGTSPAPCRRAWPEGDRGGLALAPPRPQWEALDRVNGPRARANSRGYAPRQPSCLRQVSVNAGVGSRPIPIGHGVTQDRPSTSSLQEAWPSLLTPCSRIRAANAPGSSDSI